MYRLAHKLLTILLMGMTAALGILPAWEVCRPQSSASHSCCGHCANAEAEKQPIKNCCSKSVPRATCRCSVERETPTEPQRSRHSDERKDAPRIDYALAMALPEWDGPAELIARDSLLLSAVPSVRRQAMLCRWLI